jgi:hypothetical protein
VDTIHKKTSLLSILAEIEKRETHYDERRKTQRKKNET